MAKSSPPRAARHNFVAETPRHWTAALFQPTDVASLVFFRIAFGSIMFIEIVRFFVNGWITECYQPGRFRFTYHGFEWLAPWPGVGMYLHFAALGMLAAMIALGYYYRIAACLFWLGFTYIFLLEKAHYLNHFYLLCLISFLMIFIPAHRGWSWDARRNLALRNPLVPAWSLWLLRFQIAIPYFFGGIAKLNTDWLFGQPMQMWMAEMHGLRAIIPGLGEWWVAMLFSYAGLLFDLLVVPLLLWRRTRIATFGCVIVFHGLNATMFQIGIFPWFMLCATTLYFEPDWPRRALRRGGWKNFPLAAVPGNWAIVGESEPSGWSMTHQRLVAALFWSSVVIQCLLPFRNLLYPGNSAWTEEGSRFTWRMMLRCKQTALRVLVTEPRSGRTESPDLSQWLTRRQFDALGHDPEMMREFAHFIRDRYREVGIPDVQVRMLAICSLNGRKPQLLIDPLVDLAAQPRTIGHQSFIVPLTEPFRAEAWDQPFSEWERLVIAP